MAKRKPKTVKQPVVPEPAPAAAVPPAPQQSLKERIAEREQKVLTRKCAACGERCSEKCYCPVCGKAYCNDCRLNPHDLSRFKHPAEDHLSPRAVPRVVDEEDDES